MTNEWPFDEKTIESVKREMRENRLKQEEEKKKLQKESKPIVENLGENID